MLHSYRNQLTDLHHKSIDWFLYEQSIDLKRHFASQHPTSRQASHIPNILHLQHSISPTSHILNILHPQQPHPQHPIFPTSHILDIPHPQHHTSPISHKPNASHPQHTKLPTVHITWILSSLTTNFWIHASESLNIHSIISNLRLMGNNRSQIHVLSLYRLLTFLREIFENKQ